MSAFKDCLVADLSTFINPNEFGSTHVVNGRALTITIDNDRLMERSKKEYDGVSVGQILYYVTAEEYGEPPEEYEQQVYDGKLMQVFDVRVDNGLYEIILKRNE